MLPLMEYSIDLASSTDIPALKNWFRHYYVEDVIEKHIDCYLNHNFLALAKLGKAIVGAIQWLVKEDPSLGLVEIEDLFVMNEHRNNRVGSNLMRFALDHTVNYFKNIGVPPRRAYLFVRENNHYATRLYEKFGFQDVASVGDIFVDGENQHFYVLKF